MVFPQHQRHLWHPRLQHSSPQPRRPEAACYRRDLRQESDPMFQRQSLWAAIPTGFRAGRRENLSGLPPTRIGVGTSDLILDEDRAYSKRLQDASVEVSYVEVEGAINAFDVEETPSSIAFAASQIDFMVKWVS